MSNGSKYKVVFNKPYNFEGREYKEVDLTGLEELSTQDLVDADKQFNAEGNFAPMNEFTVGYACIIASKVTGLPIEFFQRLPAPEGVKLKNMVMNFFNG